MNAKTPYRLVRMRTGMTQKEAAVHAGVSQSTMNSIETGRADPSMATLLKLADAYGCTTDELLGRAKEDWRA